jgi:tetratricopeptide (TPR) repeat protein
MKKQSIKGLAFIAVAGTLVSSCDLLKDLEYKVTPCPLEMHADSVRVKVEVKFPEKGIKKKASAELTPTIGGVAMKTVTVQGEKATGNGTVIQYKPGGTMVYNDVIAYQPSFENTELMITGKVYKGGKEKEGAFEPQEICKGTIITPYNVNKDFRVVYAKDEFKRVTEQGYMAQINYDKGKSIVKPGELKDKDIVDFGTWLAAAQSNPKIAIKSINITGYASPEGEEDKNNSLSTDRANSAKTASMEIAKKNKNEKAQTEVYNLQGRGEDFPGFEVELGKNTTMKQEDKDLILRVLKMYSDPAQRETEMRNLGKSFTDLDKNVFPKLRRAEINVVYDLTGYSDEELRTISKAEPQKLTYEELLFTATLTEDLNEKLRLYKEAAIKDPSDWRAANNVGAVLYKQGKVNEAKAQFEKANGMKDNQISKNNLGAVAGVNGDRAKATQLFGQAGSMDETKYNKGIIAIQNGKYAEATSSFGSENTYNKALAQLLDKNADAAVKTIDASPDKESAQGYYLKAIAAARQDKLDAVVSNLKSAIAKDPSMKAKAAKDMEFYKYADNAALSFIK